MKTVSKAYRKSMKQPMRNVSKVKIYFENVSTEMYAEGTWSASDEASFSNLDVLDDKTYSAADFITADLNRWTLDEKYEIRTAEESAFTSSTMSDANGEITTWVQKEISTHPALPGLTLRFDDIGEMHPREVTVVTYNNSGEVTRETFTIESNEVLLNVVAEEIDTCKVIINEILPYSHARLDNIVWGQVVTYNNNDLVNVFQSHMIEPLSRTLPLEQLEFSVLDLNHDYDPDNPEGVYSYIDKQAPISIQYGYTLDNGTVEWLKPDVYVLDGKPILSNNVATFSAMGMINTLNKTFYKCELGHKSMYDLAEAILTDAGVTNYEIDESLQEIYTDGVLPLDRHNDCLQLVSHASCSRLYTDDDNKVHIKPFSNLLRNIYKGSFVDNGHEDYSEWTTVDGGSQSASSIVSLDLNYWTLSNTMRSFADAEGEKQGYVSSMVSEADGEFTLNPLITRNFDIHNDIENLNITFDDKEETYPLELEVRYYNDSTLLDTVTVTDVSVTTVITSPLARNCNKIQIEVTKALPNSKVRISKVNYRQSDFTMDFSTIAENSQVVNKIERVRDVYVNQYGLSASADATTLYEFDTEETNVHVEFNVIATDLSVTVTGGTLVSHTDYARAVDLELSSGTKHVVITGKVVTESSSQVKYSVHAEGEDDLHENPLISDYDRAYAVGEWVGTYLDLRNTYDVVYRGNPELEVGDIIGLQTNYTPEMYALCIVDEITFNGALHGQMRLKGMV